MDLPACRVYECPDCGYQVENQVEASEEEPPGHQDPDEPPEAGDEDATAESPERNGGS